MVQIKLQVFVAFILAAVAIAPIAALPTGPLHRTQSERRSVFMSIQSLIIIFDLLVS